MSVRPPVLEKSTQPLHDGSRPYQPALAARLLSLGSNANARKYKKLTPFPVDQNDAPWVTWRTEFEKLLLCIREAVAMLVATENTNEAKRGLWEQTLAKDGNDGAGANVAVLSGKTTVELAHNLHTTVAEWSRNNSHVVAGLRHHREQTSEQLKQLRAHQYIVEHYPELLFSANGIQRSRLLEVWARYGGEGDDDDDSDDGSTDGGGGGVGGSDDDSGDDGDDDDMPQWEGEPLLAEMMRQVSEEVLETVGEFERVQRQRFEEQLQFVASQQAAHDAIYTENQETASCELERLAGETVARHAAIAEQWEFLAHDVLERVGGLTERLHQIEAHLDEMGTQMIAVGLEEQSAWPTWMENIYQVALQVSRLAQYYELRNYDAACAKVTQQLCESATGCQRDCQMRLSHTRQCQSIMQRNVEFFNNTKVLASPFASQATNTLSPRANQRADWSLTLSPSAATDTNANAGATELAFLSAPKRGARSLGSVVDMSNEMNRNDVTMLLKVAQQQKRRGDNNPLAAERVQQELTRLRQYVASVQQKIDHMAELQNEFDNNVVGFHQWVLRHVGVCEEWLALMDKLEVFTPANGGSQVSSSAVTAAVDDLHQTLLIFDTHVAQPCAALSARPVGAAPMQALMSQLKRGDSLRSKLEQRLLFVGEIENANVLVGQMAAVVGEIGQNVRTAIEQHEKFLRENSRQSNEVKKQTQAKWTNDVLGRIQTLMGEHQQLLAADHESEMLLVQNLRDQIANTLARFTDSIRLLFDMESAENDFVRDVITLYQLDTMRFRNYVNGMVELVVDTMDSLHFWKAFAAQQQFIFAPQHELLTRLLLLTAQHRILPAPLPIRLSSVGGFTNEPDEPTENALLACIHNVAKGDPFFEVDDDGDVDVDDDTVVDDEDATTTNAASDIVGDDEDGDDDTTDKKTPPSAAANTNATSSTPEETTSRTSTPITDTHEFGQTETDDASSEVDAGFTGSKDAKRRFDEQQTETRRKPNEGSFETPMQGCQVTFKPGTMSVICKVAKKS